MLPHNENNMRYHLFLQYEWFLQNLGKEAVRTNMHTTVTLFRDPWMIQWLGRKFEWDFFSIYPEKSRQNWEKLNGDHSTSSICFFVGEDSCNGDSGGPLVAKRNGIYFLEGIHSFGTKKCGQGYPSIFTSIKYYMPWIIEKIKYFEDN